MWIKGRKYLHKITQEQGIQQVIKGNTEVGALPKYLLS